MRSHAEVMGPRDTDNEAALLRGDRKLYRMA